MAYAVLFVVFISQLIIRVQCSGFNLSHYKEMPSMFHLDDYDLCKNYNGKADHGIYCVVYAEIEPNESSVLWKQIAETSRDSKHNFRHDHLFMGVCLDRCKKLVPTLSKQQLKELYSRQKVNDRELKSFYAGIHKRETDERFRYDRLINICMNLDFYQQHNLKLRSSIEYCENADQLLEYDSLDLSVWLILIVIIVFTIFSTLYDFHLKLSHPFSCQNNNFYLKPLTTNGKRLLTSFSLCRNYYRLTTPLHGSGTFNDLRFFDAFRVIGVFLVVLGHTLMIFMTIPIENPEFFEQFLYRFETSIFQNGSTVIQIFFVMSSFLLYTNFTERNLVTTSSKTMECIAVYFKVFFYRYFRLVPSLILLILFNGTILTRLQDGPFWRHSTEPERVFCRENWWKNLLFVNNYLLKESCAQQTWYIAADMQLFELFLIVIIVTKKHPFMTKYLNYLLMFFTFAVPIGLTYFYELEAVYHLNPETYRYLYFRNTETFYQIYPPFYTNLGGYLFGYISATMFLKFRQSNDTKMFQGKLKYELGMWMLLLLALGILFSGFIFIKYDFEKPSLWLALYAGIYKNLWIIICAAFVFGMCFKVGWIAYEFCCLSFFRPLAQISYQAFLWHVVVLRLISGYFRQPIYVNSFFMFCNVILAFVLTNIIAFCITLLVEYPIAEMMKILFQTRKVIEKQETKDSFSYKIDESVLNKI